MLSIPDIRLAAARDARAIAELSRDTIEQGLPWSWTPERVRDAIRNPAINVVVAQWRDAVAGFGFGSRRFIFWHERRVHRASSSFNTLVTESAAAARILRTSDSSDWKST